PPRGSIVANVEGPVQSLLRASRYTGGPGMAARGGSGAGVNADRNCLSVYLPIVRDALPDALGVFDFPEPSLVTGDREDTTVPSQALFVMNSPSVQKICEAMAARLVRTRATGTELGRKAFELAYSRSPTDSELETTAEFFARFSAAEAPRYSDREKLFF